MTIRSTDLRPGPAFVGAPNDACCRASVVTEEHAAGPNRREVLQRLCAAAAVPSTATLLAACGGGGGGGKSADPAAAPSAPPAAAPPPPPTASAPAEPAAPAPPPAASAPVAPAPPPVPPPPPPLPSVERLKAALRRAPLVVAAVPVTVTEGAAQSSVSSFGTGAQMFPPLTNPEKSSFATIPQIWGHRRDRWQRIDDALIAGNAVYPVLRSHRAATTGWNGVCGLHFVFEGRAFELLMAGERPYITVVADGQLMSSKVITTAQSGAALAAPNSFKRIDFGSTGVRRVSVYAVSSRGPCAIAIGPNDQLQPWDRSAEASFAAMSDSYGQALDGTWGISGPFWQAAAQLGIAHIDLDAVGGTGYAPQNTNAETRNPGNAFPARLPSSVDTQPDLFLTCGGINDNNSRAAPPLFATGADALASFNAAVTRYYRDLRAALPQSVLAATGPWKPRQTIPTDPVEQAKADTIKAALQSVGGPWIFLDNLNGGWVNSAGAIGAVSGPWQTGTGKAGAPAGNGNGDVYLGADGTHPNEAGCLYLGTRLATDLRAALLAL